MGWIGWAAFANFCLQTEPIALSPAASAFTPGAVTKDEIADIAKEELKKEESKNEQMKEDVTPAPTPTLVKVEEVITSTPAKEEVVSKPIELELLESEPKKEETIPTPTSDVSSEPEKKIESPVLKAAQILTPEVAPVMPEPTKKEISAPPSPVSINSTAGSSAIKGGIDTLLPPTLDEPSAEEATPVVSSPPLDAGLVDDGV